MQWFDKSDSYAQYKLLKLDIKHLFCEYFRLFNWIGSENTALKHT